MKKTLLIILAVVVAALLLLGGFVWYYMNKIQSNNQVEIVERPTDEPEQESETFVVSIGTPDPGAVSPTPEPTPEPTMQPIYAVNTRDPNVINILLAGIDSRSENADASDTANSDSMMIISYNMETKKCYIFSLMRDGALYLNGKSWYDKLNKAYGNGGVGMLINTLNSERNYDLDIQNYISITFKMFEAIIDQFGGVEVNLTTEECKFINKWLKKEKRDCAKVEEKDGPQTLNGAQALYHARDRYSGSMADFGRTSRQRRILELLYKKVKSEWTIPKLMNIITYVAEYAATNLSLEAMIQLATIAMDNDITIESTTVPFPNTSHYGTNKSGMSILTFDIAETRERLLGIIYDGQPMPEVNQGSVEMPEDDDSAATPDAAAASDAAGTEAVPTVTPAA